MIVAIAVYKVAALNALHTTGVPYLLASLVISNPVLYPSNPSLFGVVTGDVYDALIHL